MNARAPQPEPVELSVVVVAFALGDHPRRCLAAVDAQALPVGVRPQVVLAHDDRFAGAGALRDVLADVELVRVPGEQSPARLRAAGIAAARGRVVALTEDHCEPDPGWGAALLAAHAPGDGHAIVGGAIDKREPDGAVGWALYFTEYARYMRPFVAGPSAEASDCCVSYAREALAAVAPSPDGEFHQTEVHRALRERGHAPWLDPAALVRQGRTVPLGAALRERFEHGRLYASLRASHLGRARALLLAPLALALPPVFAGRIARRVVAARRYRGAFARALPAVLAIGTAWAAGECVGYLTGRRPA